jgi:hypothetical protein
VAKNSRAFDLRGDLASRTWKPENAIAYVLNVMIHSHEINHKNWNRMLMGAVNQRLATRSEWVLTPFFF